MRRNQLSHDYHKLLGLQQLGYTQQQMAKFVGLSRPRVSSILRLATATDELWSAYYSGKISAGAMEELHAIAQICPTPNTQQFIAQACQSGILRREIIAYRKTLLTPPAQLDEVEELIELEVLEVRDEPTPTHENEVEELIELEVLEVHDEPPPTHKDEVEELIEMEALEVCDESEPSATTPEPKEKPKRGRKKRPAPSLPPPPSIETIGQAPYIVPAKMRRAQTTIATDTTSPRCQHCTIIIYPISQLATLPESALLHQIQDPDHPTYCVRCAPTQTKSP